MVTYHLRVADERALEIFDHDSISRIFHVRRRDCEPTITSPSCRRSSFKQGFVGLVMLQDIRTVNWSRAYFCPHRLARGAGELETDWRRGQPRSRQTWSPSMDCEFSASHNWERIGWGLDRWAWSASLRDAVGSIGDASSTRLEWMLLQVSKYGRKVRHVVRLISA